MAFIKEIDLSEVNPEDVVRDQSNVINVHRINGKTMRLHWEFYKVLMHGNGPLSRVQREMIAVQVSVINQCHY